MYVHVGGDSWPMAAHNGIDQRIIDIPANASPEGVKQFCLLIQDALEGMISCYKGSEWDGSNHKGQWDTDGLEGYSQSIEQTAIVHQIPTPWEPSDWFGPVLDDLGERLKAGETPEQIIESEDLGDESSSDGWCDKALAIWWLNNERDALIERVSEEDEEE